MKPVTLEGGIPPRILFFFFCNGSTWCACENMASAATHVFSLQARLYSLQADPATYCNEPDGESECFSLCQWKCDFWDLENLLHPYLCVIRVRLQGALRHCLVGVSVRVVLPGCCLCRSPGAVWQLARQLSTGREERRNLRALGQQSVHTSSLHQNGIYVLFIEAGFFGSCLLLNWHLVLSGVTNDVQWINSQGSILIKHESIPVHLTVLSPQVPAAVAHSEFWQRYFYKVHQLDQVITLFKTD